MLDLYPQIFHACHERHVQDPTTKHRVSEAQRNVLAHLDSDEALRLTDLAEHLGVTPATVSIQIVRLVRQGYVARERDDADGRAVRLQLTPSGARLKAKDSVLSPARVRALLGRLSPDERETALKGLALLSRAARDEMASQSHRGLWKRRSRP